MPSGPIRFQQNLDVQVPLSLRRAQIIFFDAAYAGSDLLASLTILILASIKVNEDILVLAELEVMSLRNIKYSYR